ncbi:formate-tetrahydrofolate ligase [Saprolegnia diclina VS20]|uniref:formate--tetrahydrofolate ligase n=1 Tax=Saprolegnia diclina (strain VS20) TaxID=1156394 RepID=T0RJZ4_SAPDV|nr:formate-tetrahydrofolate ligase [Saprolegnia diclina VS20]EQC32578.1 formate-tetrahydrofolate ligase [Saprolegnia diclina VS20]|eukprot:XP_008614079.1 formate-tetrahydrofolate ligase [Saprolegnia diclina VS20]
MMNKARLSRACWLSTSAWPLKPLHLQPLASAPSDLEIAQAQKPKPIAQLATEIGLHDEELSLHGKYKAKVALSVLNRLENAPQGKYVVVGGITPTPLGEGKTTCVMGLAQAFSAHLNTNSFACVRQPSQGPIFGIKGGAAGGGYAQAIPMDEFNMHLTGDIHAITAATNLLAAAIDARIFHESQLTDETLYARLVSNKCAPSQPKFTPAMQRRLGKLGIRGNDPAELSTCDRARFARLDIDPSTLTIKRVLDTNDRFLRQISIGHSPTEKGQVRSTGFDISVASEVMAILALARDMLDMRTRIGAIVVGFSRDGAAITADDIGVAGAMMALMKDALQPTLMQTLEGSPVFVHAGPFANIAHGNSSIIADKIALKLVGRDGVVVTEAGFGADMAIEKFCNIKCASSGLRPDCIVLVATVRALKMHGGGAPVVAGKPMPAEYLTERVDLVRTGCANLRAQVQIAASFGVPVVVAVSPFMQDSPAELDAIINEAKAAGATDAVVARYHALGGRGTVDLAEAVIAATSSPRCPFVPTYDLQSSIEAKVDAIVHMIYGGGGSDWSSLAKARASWYASKGFGDLPICMAKTQYSLSHDPALKGRPVDFIVPITDVRLFAGAGFLTVLTGDVATMPGLATRPSFHDIDVLPDGTITGLS